MANNVFITANWILNVLFYGPLSLIVTLVRDLAWFDVWLIVTHPHTPTSGTYLILFGQGLYNTDDNFPQKKRC